MIKNNCFVSKNPCSGCGVCAAVCPVGAITLALNGDGFYQANLQEEKCIGCGKCVKVCPKYVQDEKQLNFNNFSVYSFIYNSSSVLENSSSGAAAWALTQLAFEQGYQVAGVVYDYTSNTAKLCVAHSLKQAEVFKGSKYVQADTQIYANLLKEPGRFLVFGTPCQLAGLAQAVELLHRREDFLLVDCFCHGVPSYLVWHSFLKHIQIENPEQVVFRSKKGGWHNFYMKVKGAQKTYTADARTNPFYQLFFSDLLLNDSCYTCKVKSAAFADIRLGDFWGADYDLTEQGVSLVLPLSPRAKYWLEGLNQKGILRDIGHLRHKIVKSQSAFSRTHCNTNRRAELLDSFAKNTFAQSFNLYVKGQSAKQKALRIFKSYLPVLAAKYLRVIIHTLRGC